MAAKTYALDASILNAVLRNLAYTSPAAVYAALNTSTSTPGAAGTEVVDANYTRVVCTFGAPVNGVSACGALSGFFGAGAAAGPIAITEVAIYDTLAKTTGNMLYYGPLSVPKTVGAGDTVSFAASALTVTEQ